MSNLLFTKHPIVVSQELAGVLTDIDPKKKPRISEAAVLQQINYWVQKKQNYHDGHYWVYNSLEEWAKQFTWIKTLKTMKRQLDWLEELGIVITGNYNKLKFDRTKWYTIDYDALDRLVSPFDQNDQMGVVITTKSEWSSRSIGNGRNDHDNTIDYTKTNSKTTTDILSGKPDHIPYKEIMDYLNQKAGTRYRASSQKTKSLIRARIKDGFTVDDFKKVIDIKVNKWKNDPKMSQYLRPVTLFGTKFESYLNEPMVNERQMANPYDRYYE